MDTEPIIRINDLVQTFDRGRNYLDHVNMHVNPGEILAIVGPSGQGKSILVRHIPRLYVPTSGEVYVFGKDVVKANPIELAPILRNLGFVFQGNALYGGLNVRDNLSLMLTEDCGGEMSCRFGIPKIWKNTGAIEDIIRKALRSVNLEGDVLDGMPSTLSGGMQKRLAIARALVHNPEVVILDEPTTGLDPENSVGIYGLIIDGGLKERNRAYVIVTHDLNLIPILSDRIIMINQGRAIYDGGVEEFLDSPNPQIRNFLKTREYRLGELRKARGDILGGKDWRAILGEGRIE